MTGLVVEMLLANSIYVLINMIQVNMMFLDSCMMFVWGKQQVLLIFRNLQLNCTTLLWLDFLKAIKVIKQG